MGSTCSLQEEPSMKLLDAYLVLDIGKTNKKFLVYDTSLKLLLSKSIEIGIVKRDGIEIENVETLIHWLTQEISAISKSYHFKNIAISCHGAAFALLNKNDELCYPIMSYTSTMNDAFFKDFTAEYGSAEKLLQETGTPDLGFINIGKAVRVNLRGIKRRFPESFIQRGKSKGGECSLC